MFTRFCRCWRLRDFCVYTVHTLLGMFCLLLCQCIFIANYLRKYKNNQHKSVDFNKITHAARLLYPAENHYVLCIQKLLQALAHTQVALTRERERDMHTFSLSHTYKHNRYTTKHTRQTRCGPTNEYRCWTTNGRTNTGVAGAPSLSWALDELKHSPFEMYGHNVKRTRRCPQTANNTHTQIHWQRRQWQRRQELCCASTHPPIQKAAKISKYRRNAIVVSSIQLRVLLHKRVQHT